MTVATRIQFAALLVALSSLIWQQYRNPEMAIGKGKKIEEFAV